jgi:hypothetical protein
MRTLIDERKYPSTRRGSDKDYTCKRWSDGDYTCDCPGWRFKQPDKPRGCSHCVWFAQDYWLVTIAEATRITLAGTKFEVVTTYARYLYLIRRVEGNVLPVQKAPKTTGTISGGTGGERFVPVLPKKAVILTPKPGRARNAFDEEV